MRRRGSCRSAPGDVGEPGGRPPLPAPGGVGPAGAVPDAARPAGAVPRVARPALPVPEPAVPARAVPRGLRPTLAVPRVAEDVLLARERLPVHEHMRAASCRLERAESGAGYEALDGRRQGALL